MRGALKRFAVVPMLGLMSFVAPTAAVSAPMIVHAPARLASSSNNAVTSTNWSGYADTGGTFTKAHATWKQPAATCPSTQHQYSSFWVGIDGYSSNSVEQLGTDSDCNGVNHPVYYAWYEMFPAGSVRLSSSTNPVHVGDTMSAAVTVAGTKFTLSLADKTAGWSFKIVKSSSTAKKSSAEWIAEAPSSCSGGSCSVLPLADFGTVKFTATTTTKDGVAGNITTFTNHKITMVTSANVVKAQPTTATSTGFSDTRHHV
jgi:hypothetical protein